MEYTLLAAFIVYFSILFVIGYMAYRKSQKTADFTLGNRSLSFWVTALAAHASETSSWVFMALPFVVYTQGLVAYWTAIGLTVFMYLNWRLIAPKLRSATEKLNSVTLSTFFEHRFNDNSGLIRIVSALFGLLFFTFYVSAGLVALGLLFESVFNVNYFIGIIFGVIVVFYSLLGGYLSISWIDFFQGMFLLVTIITVPIVAFSHIDGFSSIFAAAQAKNISLNLLPSSWGNLRDIVYASIGWGLGYFGQPHILTKFMGIQDVTQMRKAQWIGITWQILSYIAAISIGLIGLAFFKENVVDSQLIFVQMVKTLFPQFIVGFVLCAVIAAAINVMSAQVLVSASIIAEDFYKKSLTLNDSFLAKKIATVSRISVVVLCVVASIIAISCRDQKINDLVWYPWTGLGCTFGPLLLVSLYSKITNRYAALAGVIVGGTTSCLWPLLFGQTSAMIVGFFASLMAIILVNKLGKKNLTRISHI